MYKYFILCSFGALHPIIKYFIPIITATNVTRNNNNNNYDTAKNMMQMVH